MAHQGLGGGVHGLRVQRLLHVPDPAALQRRRRLAIEDAVEIGPSLGREAGMEVGAGFGCGQHHDGLAHQMGVQRVHHRGGGPGLLQVEVDHLAGGVDPGVRAAGGVDPDRLAAEGRDRPLQRGLHRREVRLRLEAVIGPAVVFHRQPIARHQ